MSGPSFSNIDLWLFELAEGNLSPNQIQQLELFLLQNPDVDIDRDVWEMAKIIPSVQEFPNTETLQRRRRPIAWFYITSAASIALLLGSMNFTTISSSTQSESLLVAESSQYQVIIGLLKKEIAQIRANEIDKTNQRINNTSKEISSNSIESVENFNTTTIKSKRVDEQNNSLAVNSIVSEIDNNGISIGNELMSSNSINNSNPSIDALIESANDELNLLSADNDIINVAKKTSSEDGNESSIETNSAEELEVLNESDYTLSSRTENSITYSNFKSKGYKESLKSRFHHLTKSFKRMANNPVALKNFRDPNYHVPGMLPNDVNFSSAGTMLRTRVQGMSRLQWLGQENEQLMSQLAVDGYVYSMRGGLGLQLNHAMYNNGGVHVSDVALTYSPKLSFNKSISIEPSVRFKMGNKSLNSSKMKDVSQVEINRQSVQNYYSEGESPVGSSLWYKDLGAGLMVNTEWFYVGAQVDNVFRHENNIFSNSEGSSERANHQIIASIGTDWVSKKENLRFSPYIVYQKNEKLSEAWAGANLGFNWFTIGGGISTQMDPAASVGLKFDRFSLAYNADYTLSEMTGNRSLSHQVTIKFLAKPSHLGRRLLNL